ncbi:MAG: hypothetical protein J6A92_03155 [Lachnospiraceae bacterium]|nr:hypothetical protein [Lachnospiraceae bacterium]
MSQEKVERYKKDKANRKATMKKEKAKSTITRIAGTIVCVALIGWIGYSGYMKWESSRPAVSTEINTDAITNYISDLSADAE